MSPPALNSAAAALSAPPCVAFLHRAPDEEVRWFKVEVEPHEGALRGWLHHRHPHLRDLDDIVQESYLRLLQARAAGKIASPKAYLYGIAHHVALETHRKQRLHAEVSVNELPESPTSDAGSNVVETVNLHQELALATEAIKTLPDRCREIVTLRAVHGLSYREIAQKLALAEETVRVQMARGVKKCAHYLRERGVTEGGHEQA